MVEKTTVWGHMHRALRLFYKNNSHFPKVDDIVDSLKCHGFIKEKFVADKVDKNDSDEGEEEPLELSHDCESSEFVRKLNKRRRLPGMRILVKGNRSAEMEQIVHCNFTLMKLYEEF